MPPPSSRHAQSGWAHEALQPPLCPLQGAKAVGRLCVHHKCPRSLALRRTLFRSHRVDDRCCSGERLHPRQRHHALRLRYGGVDAVGAAEARIGGYSRLLVVFYFE
eukprot:5838739-Pleurochrysis_carterae.AAC.1